MTPPMQIQLLRADVSSLNVDALVSPPHGLDGSPEPGGNLLCRFVITAPVEPGDAPMSNDALRRLTTHVLEKAEELAVGSVGIPPLRCGTAGDDPLNCARAMIGAAVDFRRRARSLRRVVFCLFGQLPYATFEQALGELDH